MENYSLSDIAAVTDRDRDGFDGNGSWFWIVVLFLFMFGFNRNGFGNDAATQGALTRADMCQEFNFNDMERGIRGIQQGLCDGFYSQNTTMLQGFNGVQRDLCNGFNSVNAGIANLGFQQKDCCCETNRNIDAVRAEAYKNTCEITNAIHCEGEQTRALINANTVQNLRDKLEQRDRDLLTANFQLSQQAQTANIIDTLQPVSKPAYLTCSPYQTLSGWGYGHNCGYGFDNRGCGCGCA